MNADEQAQPTGAPACALRVDRGAYVGVPPEVVVAHLTAVAAVGEGGAHVRSS